MKTRILIAFTVMITMLFSMPAAYAAIAPSPVNAPAPKTVSIGSTSSVYVDESSPAANFNILSEQVLSVGKDEFGFERQSLIRFHPIKESDGGLLPDDAEITDAHIRLYKVGSEAGTVNLYRLAGGFDESTVTWKTKPVISSSTAVASADLPAKAGWYNVKIPVSLLEAWLTSSKLNHGIAIRPSWTEAGKGISFRSDESSLHPPDLVISYIGSSPDSPAPTPDTSDTDPCTLTYTVIPENPRPGEPMTITASASDNKALSHVTIMRGTKLLARQEAIGNQTTLSVSYVETAKLPAMTYTLIADDAADPLPVRRDITVPVTGSGSAPDVRITAEWLGVERTVPERYSLIAGDGQRVVLTASADDPDGIKSLTVTINGMPHEFTYSGETSVCETLTWTNDDPDETRFSYYASAIDKENQYASTPHESFDIAGLDDIRLYWNSTPSFDNDTMGDLSWDMMVSIFGADECWWVEKWGWKSAFALGFYNAFIKDAAKIGTCFGMSTMSAEINNGRISSDDLESSLLTHQLSRANSYTGEYILARQAGQYGKDVFLKRAAQYPESNNLSNTRVILGQVENDLRRERPGIIGIREDDKGHALVPWMVRYMEDGTIRIYVYDCNKVSGIRNPDGNIQDSSQYPYIEIRTSGRWSYAFNSSKTWNDRLFYNQYEEVLGNSSRLNKLCDAADAPFITDHTMPSITETVCAFLFGSADMYFEDDQGRVTGIKDGQLKEEIPGSQALIPMGAGNFTDNEAYLIPGNVKLNAKVAGISQGSYTLGLLSGASTYTVEEKSIKSNTADRLIIEPASGYSKYKVTLASGSRDDDFTIRMSTQIPGRVKKLGTDFIGREYIFEQLGMEEGKDISLSLNEDAGGVIVSTATGGVIFDVIMRSTESADNAQEDQTSIPGSRRARISPDAKKSVTLEPENWATDETDGTVNVEEIGYAPGAPDAANAASAWAVIEIEQAIAHGLTTDGILSDFRKNITRREFCEISVKLYEKLSGRTAVPVSANPFTDTSNAEILKAYNLGIVKGVSPDRFAPDQSITRQEICVMLMRALKAAIPSLNTEAAHSTVFADENQIAQWAIDAVRYMNSKGIMKGVGSNMINPLGNTTREQAIILVKRTYEVFNNY